MKILVPCVALALAGLAGLSLAQPESQPPAGTPGQPPASAKQTMNSMGQKILDGLSFSIKEGETIALVGAIGSGKSTIFNLLLRFLDPQAGRIILDGRDISKVTLATLREQVSKLSQFPFFMKETIRENVRLGKQGASDAEVEEAVAFNSKGQRLPIRASLSLQNLLGEKAVFKLRRRAP